MTTPFAATQVIRSETLHLAAPPTQVFPLFTPLGEKAWSPEWQPTMLAPMSGEPAAGTVFITEHDQQPIGVWVMTLYAPERGVIGYVRVTPGITAGMIQVECEPDQGETTRATVTYTLTALSEAGNAAMADLTEAHYRHWMASWETAINHYLAHGRPLAHTHPPTPSVG
ncbi:MAG TPA: SRPBCC family protein [Ktedonobacterales bacterium]|nr:SRPBCC family protein [Ktedonobacterales bacterium]